MIKRLLLTLLCATTLLTGRAQSAKPAFVGPEHGALVIVGGGAIPPDVWNRFVELAGGAAATVLVVPTAGDDSSLTQAPRELATLRGLGVRNVSVLHTRSKEEANSDAFVAPIRKATGIWFVGGRHWRLADSYLNTMAQTEFNKLLERGGVIGGTSAGATIQGSFMVRGDVRGNSIMVGDHTQGLDFMHNVAIDQHVFRRNRQFDLIDVVKSRPDLLGIGIDEGTAIVVQKNTFDVLGTSLVGIYEAGQIASNAQYPSGQNSSGGPFYLMTKGQSFDLQTRSVIRKRN